MQAHMPSGDARTSSATIPAPTPISRVQFHVKSKLVVAPKTIQQ